MRGGLFGDRIADDGFSLMEVVIAMGLAVVVMTSTAGFFVRSLTTTRLMQQRQSAVGVAEAAMERIRAEDVTTIAGRDVTLEGGSSLAGNLDPAYRVGNIDYVVRTTVTDCGMATAGGPCDAISPGDFVLHRLTVNVQWKPPGSSRCGESSGLCEYSMSTLRDPAGSSTDRLKEMPSQ